MRGLFFILLILSSSVKVLYSQSYGSRHQFGANIGIQFGFRTETKEMLKLFGNCGYGYELNGMFPNLHFGAAFNLKTLSTRQERRKDGNGYKANHSIEYIFGGAMAFRFGPWSSRSTWSKDYYVGQPYYFYANLNQSPLMHPFHSSLSLGTQKIFIRDDKRSMVQRVGFFDLKIFRTQIYYQNDGAVPFDLFGETLIEKNQDRFYTSSLLVSQHFNNRNLGNLNTLSLSFNKFTGEYKRAYQVANRLRNNSVDYKDPAQYSYNLSFIGFGAKFNDIAEISLRKYNANDRVDPQNLIHYGKDFPYHINSTMEHWGVDVQRTIGVLSNKVKK